MQPHVYSLISLAVGAGLGYLAGIVKPFVSDYLTDQRREREAVRKARDRFNKAQEQMPDFLEKLRHDLSRPDGRGLVRTFYILPNHKYVIPKEEHSEGGTGKIPGFGYWEPDIPHLAVKVALLENLGYVHDVTIGSQFGPPRYRMTEEFVGQLLQTPT